MIGAGLKWKKEEALKILFGLYDEYGIEYKGIFQKFLEKVEGKVDYRILAHGIVAYRKTQVGYMEPYPNVIPTLIQLKAKGLKLAILSDAPKMNAWLRLVEMKLEHFFDVIVCLDDTGMKKPATKPFETVLNELKLKPAEVLMVGDWPERDIAGAKKMGMRTCYAKYGNIKGEECKDADFEIGEIGELVKVVEKA